MNAEQRLCRMNLLQNQQRANQPEQSGLFADDPCWPWLCIHEGSTTIRCWSPWELYQKNQPYEKISVHLRQTQFKSEQKRAKGLLSTWPPSSERGAVVAH